MPFNAIKISEHVYWVGAIDWEIRDFHGYNTKRGSTYNAYLVLADKITLIDTVKAPFKDELLARISSVIDPQRIDYIVSNHAELDHSGCLPEIIAAVRPAKIFASTMGVKALKQHLGIEDLEAVKSGDKLSLGNLNLSFLETRMLHWPDSMFSYLEEERLLFSQDAFGMHLASDERWVDELNWSTIEYEAGTYFANILLPYAPQVLKLFETVAAAGLEPALIAPDHGPLWRKDFDKIFDLYRRWSEQRPTMKAVVLYDTMWQSTAKLARAIEEGLIAGGAGVRLMGLHAAHRSEVAYEVLEAGALVVGSPTLNNNIFPSLADALTYLKGLRPKNLVGAAFGSYGWGGEAPKQVAEILDAMQVEQVDAPLRVQYVPDAAALEAAYELGHKVAARLKEACCGN